MDNIKFIKEFMEQPNSILTLYPLEHVVEYASRHLDKSVGFDNNLVLCLSWCYTRQMDNEALFN